MKSYSGAVCRATMCSPAPYYHARRRFCMIGKCRKSRGLNVCLDSTVT